MESADSVTPSTTWHSSGKVSGGVDIGGLPHDTSVTSEQMVTVFSRFDTVTVFLD